MKHRLVVLVAGLSMGVLSACGAVQDESTVTEPKVDPTTNAMYCEVCPIAPGQVESMTRTPMTDNVTGQVYCPPPCGGTCGDGVCDWGEDSYNCSWDCGSVPYCGDGLCNGGETCATCGDCGTCTPYCGDGICNGSETCATCGDCGSCTPYCGDGICQYPETRANCRIDCYSSCYVEPCP